MLIQYITVKILQKVNLLPRSCAGDYTVDHWLAAQWSH